MEWDTEVENQSGWWNDENGQSINRCPRCLKIYPHGKSLYRHFRRVPMCKLVQFPRKRKAGGTSDETCQRASLEAKLKIGNSSNEMRDTVSLEVKPKIGNSSNEMRDTVSFEAKPETGNNCNETCETVSSEAKPKKGNNSSNGTARLNAKRKRYDRSGQCPICRTSYADLFRHFREQPLKCREIRLIMKPYLYKEFSKKKKCSVPDCPYLERIDGVCYDHKLLDTTPEIRTYLLETR